MVEHPEVRRSLVVQGKISLWIKVPFTLFVGVLVPEYWEAYGGANFLWGSDIALLLACAALWLESALLASMLAIGSLPFELVWSLDVVSGAHLFGIAGETFDARLPLRLRLLSLFHVMLPPVILLAVYRLGYDRRAFKAQVVLSWIVLVVTYLATDPADNINRVFGFGAEPDDVVPPIVHLGLLMILVPALIFLPAHLFFLRLFESREKAGERGA